MRGNHFGKMFSFMSFGESHGQAMGVVIDGMPSLIKINVNHLKDELKRRAPGQHKAQTDRNETDTPLILSGILDNTTLGTPICVLISNENQQPTDYETFKKSYRPGHADETTMDKFGVRDHRGGGRASGRETVSRVIAGYFASLIIPQTIFYAYISQIGEHILKSHPSNPQIDRGEINFPDAELTPQIISELMACKQKGESIGGKINLKIFNPPKSLGEPCFDKLKSDLAKAMTSIPSCMGVTFGEGEKFASLKGSEISHNKNAFGGVEGGISNGETISLTLYFKAPSTVGEKATQGRHDPCILPRVTSVVEAMAKVTLADHYLRQNAYRL